VIHLNGEIAAAFYGSVEILSNCEAMQMVNKEKRCVTSILKIMVKNSLIPCTRTGIYHLIRSVLGGRRIV
jgi:hypothetical protein